ncbi:MAG: NUDIX pyrophosphatase [Bacteroidetes bacterium]|nr:NUDIX pyrophosphatase [Bacteroidota bacterium]
MEVTSYLVETHIFREVENSLEFLLLKRSQTEIYPNIWQMVTGSIKKGEKAYETALREVHEETGLSPVEFWVVPHTNSFYSHERDVMCLVPVFVMRVEAKSQVKISDEHSEFMWVNKEKAIELLAWQGQRKSVEIIHEYIIMEKSKLVFVKLSI